MNKSDGVLFEGGAILEGVARQVASDVGRFFSKERVERTTLERERLRVARELHDGVLQSLSGAILQLHALSRAVDSYPEPVRTRLREVEAQLAAEQRSLRVWIEALRPTAPASMASAADIGTALRALCESVGHRGLRVALLVADGVVLPRTLGDEIYRLVQEGLTNIVRHAQAKAARVEVGIDGDEVRVLIEDDGLGFPFVGRYDLAQLDERGLGPVSIRGRVAALGGRLVLASTPSGSGLEIRLPLTSSRGTTPARGRPRP